METQRAWSVTSSDWPESRMIVRADHRNKARTIYHLNLSDVYPDASYLNTRAVRAPEFDYLCAEKKADFGFGNPAILGHEDWGSDWKGKYGCLDNTEKAAAHA